MPVIITNSERQVALASATENLRRLAILRDGLAGDGSVSVSFDSKKPKNPLTISLTTEKEAKAIIKVIKKYATRLASETVKLGEKYELGFDSSESALLEQFEKSDEDEKEQPSADLTGDASAETFFE